MAYTKTTWVNDSPPDINAENLNKMEQGIADAQFPEGGTTGQVLKKTADGIAWGDDQAGTDAVWGNITGSLENQTDLNNALTALNNNLSSLEDEIDSIGTATSIEDTEPYLFKSSARENVVGNLMNVQKIIGSTVAWNQLSLFLASENYSVSDANATFESGIATITNTGYNGRIYHPVSMTANHKYLVIADTINENGAPAYIYADNIDYYSSGLAIPSSSIFVSVAKVFVSAGRANSRIFVRNLSSAGTIKVKNLMLLDLTKMFGSTIADYIYSLEQATAGAGVAWLKSHGFMTKDYYAYNAGELISVKTSAHVMRDANNNIIGNYPLDPDLELRGLPKLDSDNNLYYDGDEYEPSGTVTRKYGIVDLGTLNWTKNADYSGLFACATLSPETATYEKNVIGNFIVSKKYKIEATANNNSTASTRTNKSIFGRAGYDSWLYLRDDDFTTLQELIASLSGNYLVYELKTPTTKTADAYDKQQVFDVTGTEEYVDTRAVPIPVGHDTFFPTSLTSRIDALEDEFNEEINSLAGSLAMVETSPATSNHAVGDLIVYNNQLYKVTVAIASGEAIVVGTNVSGTSVGEQTSSLNSNKASIFKLSNVPHDTFKQMILTAMAELYGIIDAGKPALFSVFFTGRSTFFGTATKVGPIMSYNIFGNEGFFGYYVSSSDNAVYQLSKTTL